MNILDGQKLADDMLLQLKEEIAALKQKTGMTPGLTVVLVGDNPASKLYIKTKEKVASDLAINSQILRLPHDVPKDTLIDEIKKLNDDKNVHGILVQLPLPPQFNEWEILDLLNPEKDADRFHPQNLGRLMLNRTDIFPCTPFGCLRLLDHYGIDTAGMNTVVLGRSYIVGKPMAGLLTNRNATVTICHSKTKNIAEHLQKADLIVAAIGKPGFVKPDMVKQGAILIDVGINYLEKEEDVRAFCTQSQINKFAKKGYGITGDIHPQAFEKSSWYTPVPGGAGPMTVTMLMYNTLQLFKQQLGLK